MPSSRGSCGTWSYTV
ncbi:hypothetical protein LINPERHAP1_LOCUS26257 [Linum perenne]